MQMRYKASGPIRDIDDWPSVNLLVRKDIFIQIGGFDTNYWPGEDTKLCLDIVQTGKRIVYDPAVVCWHHRATTPLKHLQQVARYGLHRGHFAHKFPATSRRLSYFSPSLVLAGVAAATALALAMPASRLAIGATVTAAMLVIVVFAMIEAWRSRQWPVVILYPVLLSLTHLVYGIMFLKGLLVPSLKQYQRSTR